MKFSFLPDDEGVPTVTLDATNALAPRLLKTYADELEAEARMPGRSAAKTAAMLERVAEARMASHQMSEWQLENRDKVAFPE